MQIFVLQDGVNIPVLTFHFESYHWL